MAVRTVKGLCLDITGNPVVNASITCDLSVSVGITATGELVAGEQTTVSAADGTYSFNVYANADITQPTGTSYVITMHSPTAFMAESFSIVVPSGAYNGSRPTYFDLVLDNLIVAVPATPGNFITGPMANFKGNWSAVAAYAVNDAVFDVTAGSSYICTVANTNHEPPNASYWNLLASAGAVISVAAGDGTLTAGGTGSAPTLKIALGNANDWTGNQSGPWLDSGGAIFNVKSAVYGAKGNGKVVTDGAMNGTTAALACTTSTPFASGDVGKVISVAGAGAAGVSLSTTISAFTDSGHVTLAASSATAVSAASVAFGTDDTTAINAANSAAYNAGGGIVAFPPGIFVTTAALNCAENTIYQGSGRGATTVLKVANHGVTVLLIQSAGTGSSSNNNTIRDMTFSMSADGTRQTSGHGIQCNSNRVLFDNVEVSNVTSSGIYVSAWPHSSTTTHHATVRNCVVHDTSADGIFVDQASEVVVEGNHCYNTGDDAISIHSQTDNSTVVSHVTVADNIILNSGNRGILVAGGTLIEASGNMIDGTQLSGICVEQKQPGDGSTQFQPWSQVALVRNTVANAGKAAAPTYSGPPTGYVGGILVLCDSATYASGGLMIANNTIITPVKSFIYIYDIAGTVDISDVSIAGNDFVGPVLSTMTGNQSVPAASDSGVYVNGVSTLVFRDNHMNGANAENLKVVNTGSAGTVEIIDNYFQAGNALAGGSTGIVISTGVIRVQGNRDDYGWSTWLDTTGAVSIEEAFNYHAGVVTTGAASLTTTYLTGTLEASYLNANSWTGGLYMSLRPTYGNNNNALICNNGQWQTWSAGGSLDNTLDDGSGNMILSATLSVKQSATAVATAASGTIATASLGVSRVSPTGAVAGVILQTGTTAGQTVTVVNEAVAANTVTFAVAGTSHVADGVNTIIPGLASSSFVWDSSTSLWYRSR